MNEHEFQASIIGHYKNNWGIEPSIYLWDKGPFERLPHNFRVLEFPPTATRNMWTYATCCMSQPGDEKLIELHLFSDKKDDSLIELLTSVAYFHHRTAKLDLNHTINFGRSWQDKSDCKFGYISLPYLDGPSLELLELIKENTCVHFYWLLPITGDEKNFKVQYGSEALEKLFDRGIEYTNPLRESTV